MPVSTLTTAELQRTARAVMRAYLDREANRAADLDRYLISDAVATLEKSPPHQGTGIGVAHADVGPVSLLRLGPDRAYACAAVPGADPTAWAVLSVELVAQGDRLLAGRVGRVAAPGHGREPGHEAPPVGDEQPLPEPPAHLRGLLGALPENAEARIRCMTAAAVVDTYRERYDVHDPTAALGAQPVDGEQLAERERALAYTRALVAEIDSIEPDRPSRDLGLQRPPGPDLGR